MGGGIFHKYVNKLKLFSSSNLWLGWLFFSLNRSDGMVDAYFLSQIRMFYNLERSNRLYFFKRILHNIKIKLEFTLSWWFSLILHNFLFYRPAFPKVGLFFCPVFFISDHSVSEKPLIKKDHKKKYYNNFKHQNSAY